MAVVMAIFSFTQVFPHRAWPAPSSKPTASPRAAFFFPDNPDVRKKVAFHPMQLIGDVCLHLSNRELLAHRNEVLPLFVVAQMLFPDSLTDEMFVSSIAMSCLNLRFDSVPRSKSHLSS